MWGVDSGTGAFWVSWRHDWVGDGGDGWLDGWVVAGRDGCMRSTGRLSAVSAGGCCAGARGDGGVEGEMGR